MIRTYSELRRFDSFEDRYEYLKLNGTVGRATFGFDRYLNQKFYTSTQWRQVRNKVIARDSGLDLAVLDHEIFDKILVHHMNPMVVEDIDKGLSSILDPEFLITVSHQTHNAIHYGDASLLQKPFTPRQPGDTRLW